MIKMKYLIMLACIAGFAYSQTVNNVRLVDHTSYMINFLQEVANELEHREWCNLKVPDITIALNETVLDHHYSGTVTYSNGFLASMQWIDILQRDLNQIWSWNSTDSTGTVLVTGVLRMLDVELGYDVLADLEDGHHRFTMTITYPINSFTFNIRRNVNTEAVTIDVASSITTTTTSRIKFLPFDSTSDVLTTVFNVRLPEDGIRAWVDVFEPIALDVYNKLEFPRICYDCPV